MALTETLDKVTAWRNGFNYMWLDMLLDTGLSLLWLFKTGDKYVTIE